MVSPHFCCFSPQLQSVAAPGPKNGQVISYMNFHGTLDSRSHNIRTPNANPNPVGVLSPYPPSARLLPRASPRRQLGQQPNYPNGGRPWLPMGNMLVLGCWRCCAMALWWCCILAAAIAGPCEPAVMPAQVMLRFYWQRLRQLPLLKDRDHGCPRETLAGTWFAWICQSSWGSKKTETRLDTIWHRAKTPKIGASSSTPQRNGGSTYNIPKKMESSIELLQTAIRCGGLVVDWDSLQTVWRSMGLACDVEPHHPGKMSIWKKGGQKKNKPVVNHCFPK